MGYIGFFDKYFNISHGLNCFRHIVCGLGMLDYLTFPKGISFLVSPLASVVVDIACREP